MKRRTFLALPAIARGASTALFNRLYEAVQALDCVDTHEHFPAEHLRTSQKIDFFTLVGHYTINDLIAAGLPSTDAGLLSQPNVPSARKWALFEPYWRYVRNTGYGQALTISIREVYGVGEISSRTLPRIDEAIARRNQPGIYKELLAKSRIRFVVNDAVVAGADRPLLRPSRRFDHIVAPHDLALAEKVTQTSLTSLAVLKKALADHVAKAVEQGMVAIKVALAYQRDLTFEDVPEADAAADFERFLLRKEPRPTRRIVDHMVHTLLQLASDHKAPVQVHTGLLSGNGSQIEATRPTQLVNVLLKYPGVRFDLFHNGYPYLNEFGVLVKQFPNVWGNFCWTHILSPSAARGALRDMLDSAPANKILAFGGDYRYPELSYGHLVLARRNIASVLAERVSSGASTETEAVELARWMLHDNAAHLFGRTAG